MQTTNTSSFSSRFLMWFKQFKLKPNQNTPPNSPSHQAALSHLRSSFCAPCLWYISHVMGKPSQSTERSCRLPLGTKASPLHCSNHVKQWLLHKSSQKASQEKTGCSPSGYFSVILENSCGFQNPYFLSQTPAQYCGVCVPSFPVCIFCQALKL